MEIKRLSAEKRECDSKRLLKKCRKEGYIPAVLYGGGKAAESIKVKKEDFESILKKREGTFLIRLMIEDAEFLSIIKEIQRDPIKRNIIHIDFQRIKEDEEVKVDVPIKIIAPERPGIIVEHFLHKLHIQCLPSSIPDHVEIDARKEEIPKSFYVKDIKVDGVKILNEPSQLVAAITESVVEEEKEEVSQETE